MRRVPKLREWFFSEKKGFAGIFYKGSFLLLSLPFSLSVLCFSLDHWHSSVGVRLDLVSSDGWLVVTLTLRNVSIDLFPGHLTTSYLFVFSFRERNKSMEKEKVLLAECRR